MDAKAGDLQVLRDGLMNLEGLFLLCTVGEFNSGKSSLINALVGATHCAVGVLPTTAAITLLRHPASADHTSASPSSGVSQQEVPTHWLRDVSIVDTPGTNTLDATHTALTQEFLPRADSLLFVTSAERPLSESEVTFLRQIKTWGKKLTFVVNKADLLTNTDELSQVIAYVEKHASAELGEHVPVFPVSARTALALKDRAAARAGEDSAVLGVSLKEVAQDDSERVAAAQWKALECHVLSVVQSEERAAAKLESQLRLASALLTRYEEMQLASTALAEGDLAFVEEARRRLDAWEADAKGDLDARRASIEVVMHGLGQRGQDFLQEEVQLWQLPRLLRRDEFVARFQQRVVADANAKLQRKLEEVAEWMDHKGAAQARDTLELLTSRLTRVPQVAPKHETPYLAQRHALVLELHKAGTDTMTRYDPQSAATRMANAAQTSIAQAALLQAGAVGISSMVAVKAAALADLTGLLPAALLLATGLGLLPMQRLRLQREYRLKVSELSASLDEAVRSHLLAELKASKMRCLDLVSPFAVAAKAAHAQQADHLHALRESRTELEEIARDIKQIRG